MNEMKENTQKVQAAAPENGNQAEDTAAVKATEKTIMDPEEQIRQFSRGKMTLQTPIRDGENVVTELQWDFLALTGAEYVDALDRDTRAANAFRITSTQAFNLFAAAAGKATPGIDATDIRRGMGIMDAQKAAQLATVFFSASNRVGNRRIYNA